LVAEQYHKEAHLQRKRDFYVPLHAEVRDVLVRLTGAREGRAAYPQEIGITAPMSDGLASLSPPTSIDGGSLWRWTAIRSDSRVDNFNERGRQLLDAAVESAEKYNAAVAAVRSTTETVLAATLSEAIARTRRSRDFELWQRNHGYMPPPSDGLREHWFSMLDGQESHEELAAQWALWWLAGTVVSQPSSLLGWLCPDTGLDAASLAAWTELETEQTYQGVKAAETTLFEAVGQAEKHLADGLKLIRDRYEGGEPLV
jgi:hypothetical protein